MLTPRRGIEARVSGTVGDGTVTVTNAPLAWDERPETGTLDLID